MSHRTIDVNALSDGARHALADEVFAIYQRIFHGWTRERLGQALADRSCALFRLRIFLDAQREPMGFAWINCRAVTHEGRTCWVFHTMGGLDGAGRQKGLVTSFFTGVIVRFRLAHPWRQLYCAQRLIHPASYLAWARAMYRVYPSRLRPTPPTIQGLARRLSQVFAYQLVDEREPFVVWTDNHVLLSPQDRQRWAASTDPDVRFFSQLTGMRDGHALIALFSLGFVNVWVSVLANVFKTLSRHLRRAG